MDQLPRPVAPREFGHCIVGLITVALQPGSLIALEELQRMFPSPAGGIVEQHDGRPRAAMASIIGDHGPEPAGLRGTSAGIEHLRISEIPDSDYANSRTGVSVIPGQFGHG